MKYALLWGMCLLVIIGCAGNTDVSGTENQTLTREVIVQMVEDHAEAWKTGDAELLDSLLHEDVVFAYPGRRLNKNQTMEDLEYFASHFNNTEVYIHTIISDVYKDGSATVAVEWQFATTKIETGERQVVSDAIIGKIADGKFIVWKEYLDGRVKLLQATGELEHEEGEEPYPWPEKTALYGTVS